MKNIIYILIIIVLSLNSCIVKENDDYNDLVEKIEINPAFEQSPPIATNIFIEVLKEADESGNNLRFTAEFEKGIIEGRYLAVLLNDKKVVLRDDGKGADKIKDDRFFSINIKEEVETLKKELSQRQRLGLSEQSTPRFKNRRLVNESKNELIEFSTKVIEQGKLSRIPLDLLKGVRGLSDQEKTLLIKDKTVVEDPTRTFNPCTRVGTPNGVWTFGELMRQMASSSCSSVSDLDVSNFVRSWLSLWKAGRSVNGEFVNARNSIDNLILDWENKSSVSCGGILKMEFAPFKLIAIVNRLDLRGNSGYGFSNAGEGRLVFNALNASCSSMPFTVIFEYGINKRTCSSVKAFAEEWDNLNSIPLGSTAYNSALESITNQFTLCGTNPLKPNQNSINQIRTNERAIGTPWELREFNLKSSGQLELVDVKQEPAVKYNGFNPTTNSPVVDVEKLVKWVNDNTLAIIANNYTVPLNLPGTTTPFRGGHSIFVNDNSNAIWNGRGNSGSQFITNDEARHVFSLNTCSGCHGGETNTRFTHINPSSFGTNATLSGFLTGITVNDPANRPSGSSTNRTFNDLLRREIDLNNLITNNCSRGPFFGLAHKLTFKPTRMAH